MYELYKTVRGETTVVGYYPDSMAGAAAIEEDCMKNDDVDVIYELKKCEDKNG